MLMSAVFSCLHTVRLVSTWTRPPFIGVAPPTHPFRPFRPFRPLDGPLAGTQVCYVRAGAGMRRLALTDTHLSGDWMPPAGVVPRATGPSQWVMGFTCSENTGIDSEQMQLLRALQRQRARADPLSQVALHHQHEPGCVEPTPTHATPTPLGTISYQHVGKGVSCGGLRGLATDVYIVGEW